MHGGAGLVLTGGGARAAYQAGVLRGIAEVLGDAAGGQPFPILTGLSAGALNAAFLAAHADDFLSATEALWDVWAHLRVEDVFRTSPGSLGALGVGWIRDLAFGGALRRSSSTHLLDTTPLRRFLDSIIDFDAIARNVDSGCLRGVAISATSYHTGTAISFYDAAPDVQPWARTSRLGKRARLELPHVLASAAIPILFAPVRIEDEWFGDGGIRLTSPLSPALHLGADRLIAIGIRYQRPSEVTRALNETAPPMADISAADIAGVVLNGTFLDSLEADAERMQRINQTIGLMTDDQAALHPHRLRVVPLLMLRPSQDLGQLAAEEFHRFPAMLRYMLRGIGATDEKGWDLLSYLSFDRGYTVPLLELGRADTLLQRDAVRAFFGLSPTAPPILPAPDA